LNSFVEATAVEVALELGDVPLLAVVAAHLVKDLDEDGEEASIWVLLMTSAFWSMLNRMLFDGMATLA
jgi:hypothetical protein